MSTYYVDSNLGRKENDGLSELTPKSSYRDIPEIKPGDTVLIKAGSVFRDHIFSPNGEEGKVITWDMYGTGPKPLFLGSVNLHDRSLWTETEDKNIWACKADFENDVCNIIFDGGESCGILAWEYEDLDKTGKWHYTHMGYDRPGEKLPKRLEKMRKVLYLCCEGHPCDVYKDIECAVYGARFMIIGNKYISFNNMSFKYSGVHGYGQDNVKCVSIRNCEFRFIGGCVWSRQQRIRFGNAVELWEHGEDFVLENCFIDEVYDSCTTYQGPAALTRPPKNVFFINNIFKNYGMAAFELRDVIAESVHFDGNICIGAGLGFALQGEVPPRKSELWPQPMGHHLFIWRVPKTTENGLVTIRNNIFHEAPYGAAVYSTILPEADRQIVFENNIYYKSQSEYLIRRCGKNYGKDDFELYRQELKTDNGSRVEKLF